MTTFGTPLIVSATSTPLLSIAELSDTLLICVYEVTGNLKARTITVTDTSLSNNAEANVDTVGTILQAVVVAISATEAILVYADNTSDTKARLLTVTGTTVNVQSPTDVVNSGYFDLAKISSTTALWCYELSGDVTAAVLSVSGTTVSVGTPQVIDTTTTASVKCAVYSSTKSICTWNNTTASSEGAIVNLSGTTVSPQTPKTIKTRTTDTGEYATFCLGLSSTKAIHGHSGAVDSYLNVLTLNGNTFDIGTETTIVLKDYAAMHAGKLLDTRFIMLGESAGVMDAREYYLSGVSLDELTQDGASAIGATAGGPIWGCPIDGTHICAMYGGSAKAAVVTSTAPAVASAFRFLGFDADNENLYISGLKDGTLKLYDYDLAALGENGTAEFGSGTDTEIDDLERGIFPVTRPVSDQILYLYGRDGNNIQVQYNDMNGTLGWVDIGPGTATWETTKFAVALTPEPTRPDDVVVAFTDDDIYRTRFGTVTWVKMGDATTGIRVGSRNIAYKFNELLVGGTVAGSAYYSHNFGASFADASGTAMGTINAFEYNL